ASGVKVATGRYGGPSGKNIHRFPDKKDFEAAKIDPDEWGVKPDAGLEVKMKDDERLDYLLWRNDRDVVRTRAKPPEKGKDGKEKKPFVDRVLQKAVEHLKKELSKTPEVPVKRDA